MKKLLVLLVFAVAAFAQRGGSQPSHAPQGQAPQPHFSAPSPQQPHFNNQQPQQQPRFNQPQQSQGWNRFGQPGMQRPPMRPPMRPPIIIQRPVVVRPYFTYGYYPWSTYYDWGFMPYYPWFYDNGVMMYREPKPCKKETLKDSSGVKHQVLVCLQPDGTTQVTDADTLVPAPKK